MAAARATDAAVCNALAERPARKAGDAFRIRAGRHALPLSAGRGDEVALGSPMAACTAAARRPQRAS
ncbi:hypothetical protein [Azospira restricta]|uniref:Uncharacterized protein n=1 Tax=Azospira restricta TaxID=404405 RepID=A0A974SPC4_9RHOO|nr:hypothetical protein [Azospira restricta]QRJ63971.1 hypothetical protein IWH25_01005 [Azospira restricta]